MLLFSLNKQLAKAHQKKRFNKNYGYGSFNTNGAMRNVAPFVKFLKITNLVPYLK